MHPCQKCGACCSVFKVSFPVKELGADSFEVPKAMTVKVSEEILALRFASPQKPRCLALQGHIGQSVGCSIYENRPSPCRKFQASYETGQHEPRCDEARRMMNLPALTLSDWGIVEETEVSL